MFGEGGVGIRNLNIDNLISLEEMFYGARGFNEDVTGWDISHVKNLRRLFEGTNFDRNIGDWNTSAVTNMEATFYNTPFNQDISDWDTSQVERMGVDVPQSDSGLIKTLAGGTRQKSAQCVRCSKTLPNLIKISAPSQ